MKKEFAINGMSCKHCVARVEETVNGLAGVDKIKVNLKKAAGTVKFDETQIDPQAIAAAITEAGYPAEVK
ncbi:copper ion binding protein [Enterococcus canis]|uniref:Copper chaperone CopZ n=1 Tax=Enterococcus canis TaxID=214095 RepID=A0A1L8RJA7_9ENTE|nr:copper chaperone CopZ [Enterococcus canis]OJG19847.1 copper ion binding protein [Enterococcus canis]